MRVHLAAARVCCVCACAICLLAGCGAPEPRVRALDHEDGVWAAQARAADVRSEGVFYVTESVPLEGDGAPEGRARRKIAERAVDMAVREALRDPAAYTENEPAIRARFVSEPEAFVEAIDVIRVEAFPGADGERVGMRARVRIAREKLQRGLQEEGILRAAPLRIILVLRKGGGLEHADDLAEGLSRDLADRGFRPKLWNDVRRSIAERRDDGDRAVDAMMSKYVEESDWRRPEDDRYELPLLLLRTEGRLLVGFQVVEMQKVDLAYHATVRADSYDLLNGQSVGYDVVSARRPIGGDSLAGARQQLIQDLCGQLVQRHVTKLVDFVERERRRARAPYELSFEGYGDGERARIESLLAAVLSEDVDVSSDGRALRARARVARDPIPLRDELSRTLRVVGLPARASRTGNHLSFVKE
jgi:hypothetical protein